MPLKYLKTLKDFILKCPSGDIIHFVRKKKKRYVGITSSLQTHSMISMSRLHSLLAKTCFPCPLYFKFSVTY